MEAPRSPESNSRIEELRLLIAKARVAEAEAWERAKSTLNFLADFFGGMLVPTIGDMATSLYFYQLANEDARDIKMPKKFRQKILRYYVLDAVLGALPGVGDLVDLLYRANTKTARVFTAYRESLEQELALISDQ